MVDEFGNVSAVGIGKATIHITADAQVGDGSTTTITDSIEIEVTPEIVVALNPAIEIHQIPADSSDVSNADDLVDEPLTLQPVETPEPISADEPTTEQQAEQSQEVAA